MYAIDYREYKIHKLKNTMFSFSSYENMKYSQPANQTTGTSYERAAGPKLLQIKIVSHISVISLVSTTTYF